MPERPPAQWFYRAVNSIAATRPQISDPQALAGWVWYNWMSPQAKRQALRGEFDPAPISKAVNLLPLAALAKYGLLDPQFKRGVRRGFGETFRVGQKYGASYYPFRDIEGRRERERAPLRQRQVYVYGFERPRKREPRYAGRSAARSTGGFPSLEATQRFLPGRGPTPIKDQFAAFPQKAAKRAGIGIAGFKERERRAGFSSSMRGAHRRGSYMPTSEEIEARAQKLALADEYVRTRGEPVVSGGRELPRERAELKETGHWDRARVQLMRRGRKHGPYFDPDHLGDLISRQQQLIAEEQNLLEEMMNRDTWIDEQYGPLREEYADQPYTREYDRPSPEELREIGKRMRRKLRAGEYRQFGEHDPTRPDKPFDWVPEMQEISQDVLERSPLAKEQRSKIRGPTMTVEEFQKQWADPNQRHILRKLRRIYDPATNRIIDLSHNLKTHDPKKYPIPIDIHGYADEHAGVMLRLVPQITGLSPKNLETHVHPERGGVARIVPEGSLVEIQAKYPRHQWENDILPKMIADPTNEVDLRRRRIVRRGKHNLATNIFLDSE